MKRKAKEKSKILIPSQDFEREMVKKSDTVENLSHCNMIRFIGNRNIQCIWLLHLEWEARRLILPESFIQDNQIMAKLVVSTLEGWNFVIII